MAKGDKSEHAGKQKRRAGRVEDGHEKRGAARGEKPGTDRSKDENTAPYRKGGKGGQH